MFTGIITGLGRITELRPLGRGLSDGKQLVIDVPAGYLDDVHPGDSIALNGACMTVTALDRAANRFHVDISPESLDKTTGLDGAGPVNLEKALRANDRLGGHLVSGHVDGIGEVTRFAPVGDDWRELRVLAPAALGKFLAYKGSMTVNGVSLTVNSLADRPDGCEFSVNLIPQTLRETSLGSLAPGQRVNLEVDLIARYVARMLGMAGDGPASSA